MEQQLEKLTQAILERGELIKQLQIQCEAIQASVRKIKPIRPEVKTETKPAAPVAANSTPISTAIGCTTTTFTRCLTPCPTHDADAPSPPSPPIGATSALLLLEATSMLVPTSAALPSVSTPTSSTIVVLHGAVACSDDEMGDHKVVWTVQRVPLPLAPLVMENLEAAPSVVAIITIRVFKELPKKGAVILWPLLMLGVGRSPWPPPSQLESGGSRAEPRPMPWPSLGYRQSWMQPKPPWLLPVEVHWLWFNCKQDGVPWMPPWPPPQGHGSLLELFTNAEMDVQIVKLAGLLHDSGHGPFSHPSELGNSNYVEAENKYGRAMKGAPTDSLLSLSPVHQGDELIWCGRVSVAAGFTYEYSYHVVDDNRNVLWRESGEKRKLVLPDGIQDGDVVEIHDWWQDAFEALFLRSAFRNVIFSVTENTKRELQSASLNKSLDLEDIVIQVIFSCPRLGAGFTVVVTGSNPQLGNWRAQDGLKLNHVGDSIWNANGVSRKSEFQVCSEVAYFQVALKIHVFRTNLYYGDTRMAASKIVFTKGSQDPWHHASKQKSSEEMPSYLIKCSNCGHGTDLSGPQLPFRIVNSSQDEVMKWVEFSSSFVGKDAEQHVLLGSLNHDLSQRSVLLASGFKPSVADIVVFATVQVFVSHLSDSELKKYPHILRWMDYIQNIIEEEYTDVQSLFGGYSSFRLYKMFKGSEWKKNTLKTACMVPGIVFTIFFILNAIIWVIEIPSDANLADIVEMLSKNKMLSAPIRNADAPEDASWIDKYIGIVEFAGMSMWLLNQSEAAANVTADSAVGSPVANLAARLGSFTFRRASSSRVETTTDSESDETASVGGSIFETLTSSEFYKNTKVGDISGSFRWAPFLALQTSDTFLTMLLLLSKYRMKSLPVVDMGVRSLLVLDTVGSYLGYKIPRQIPGCFHDEAELDTVQQKHGGVCVSVWGQAEIQGERNVTDRLS